MIFLRSSEGINFAVEEVAISEAQLLKQMIEDGYGASSENAIPLPNVSSKILFKVFSYCKKHVTASEPNFDADALKKFDEEFVRVDKKTLLGLIEAANFLDIKGLLHLTCQAVANMIQGRTTEQIRRILNIPKDFTPEEWERVQKESSWAFTR